MIIIEFLLCHFKWFRKLKGGTWTSGGRNCLWIQNFDHILPIEKIKQIFEFEDYRK